MWDVVGLCMGALVAIMISHWLYRWQNPKCKGKLPPGSMGLPLIGETLHFFYPTTTYDIPPFIKTRMTRYGSLFRTSIVGQKVIVSTDHEFNYQIFQQEGKSFKIWYLETFNKIVGENQSLLAYQGTFHKYLKNLILHLLSPQNLKERLILEMGQCTRSHILTWVNHGGIVDVKEGASNMVFEFIVKKLLSYEEMKEGKKLKENFNSFMDGLISFPLNIPGTAFHTCIQGRNNVIKAIKDIINERKASKTIKGDYLDHLLEEMEKDDKFLNEAIAVDMIFLILFASFETASSTITLAIKMISDHPQVLAQLTKEYETIIKSRGCDFHENSEITWEEYKAMTFTHMVINEVVRLANIVPGIFRKVVNDVQIKGYTIPANWLVMVVPSVAHLSDNIYKDPLKFNPWRWQGKELHTGSKTFMAFGGGARLCVGADFAKLEMAIFIFQLVSRYRWTIIKGGEIVRKPGLMFPNGLHIKISEKHNKERCHGVGEVRSKGRLRGRLFAAMVFDSSRRMGCGGLVVRHGGCMMATMEHLRNTQ
ncbi:cytochrome P450 87A3-like [Humulus lupulus]|uniref:cytochrome P450 87A3-like n=1 Tax=Humulus lupulus TaxID=3486 RepID=UPI002B40BB3A|nr:cytochrome P450 87A3-like [Humulus lupulus]